MGYTRGAVSRLVDRLQRVSDGAPQPMGFAPAARPERAPPLVLIAYISKPSDKITSAAVENGAEFVVVPFGASGRTKPSSPAGIGEAPWGIRAGVLSETAHGQLKEAGCDFVVVDATETPVRLLGDEDVSVVATVPAGTEDRVLRAVDCLPCDVVWVDAAPGETLTLGAMVEYSAIATGVGQNLLVPASASWGKGELEQLRDAGFAGIVVTVGTVDEARALKDVLEAIRQVPNRSRRRDERIGARVPQLSVRPEVGPPPPTEPDFDPDEDDDDDY